jgi:Ca2+-binding EF-hand superfamily protein
MGNTTSTRLTKEEIDSLHSDTHFDPRELKEIYKQFKKETPSGAINKRDFKELMKGVGVQDPFLQDLIFGTFDRDKDGNINFKEFVTGLSVITRGSPDEKLECLFLFSWPFRSPFFRHFVTLLFVSSCFSNV